MSRLKQVVLPAPFGPISAWMVPRSTRRLTPLTATNPANSLVKSSVSRMNSLIRAGPSIEPPFRGASAEPSRPPKVSFHEPNGWARPKEPARMANHPGGPLRPTRGEGGGRARRSQLSKSQVLVDAADLHGADVDSRRRCTGAPSGSGDSRRRRNSCRRRPRCWQPRQPTIAPPRMAAPRPQPPRAWASLVGMARPAASVSNGKRGGNLGLDVHGGLPLDLVAGRYGPHAYWSDRERKGSTQRIAAVRAMCEKSQARLLAAFA